MYSCEYLTFVILHAHDRLTDRRDEGQKNIELTKCDRNFCGIACTWSACALLCLAVIINTCNAHQRQLESQKHQTSASTEQTTSTEIDVEHRRFGAVVTTNQATNCLLSKHCAYTVASTVAFRDVTTIRIS
jgi:hypothetical protein